MLRLRLLGASTSFGLAFALLLVLLVFSLGTWENSILPLVASDATGTLVPLVPLGLDAGLGVAVLVVELDTGLLLVVGLYWLYMASFCFRRSPSGRG
mgnify:CR=1 FL=1